MFPILYPQPQLILPVTSGVQFWGDATNTPLGATNWTDQSGNGFNAIAPTTPKMPVNTAGQLNGKNALVFVNASAQTLALPSGIYGVPNAANTTFAVAKLTAEVGSLNIILDYSDGGANNDRNATFYGNTAGQIAFKNTNGGGATATSSGNTNTNANIITTVFDGTTGQTVYVNRGNSATNTQGTLVPNCVAAYIGSRSNSAFFASMSLSELIIYNRQLTATEILLMNRYLSGKYSIAIS